MYIVINKTNSFDPANNLRFATEEEAEAKVAEMLTAQPFHVILTAELLKSFKATVTVESGPVSEETSAASDEGSEAMPE